MAGDKQNVLMVHLDDRQGELWRVALESQGFVVRSLSPSTDLVEFLSQTPQTSEAFPDLLLVDMGLKSPSSETLQSMTVCQWLKERNAPVRVILFNPRQDKIRDLERSHAMRKGAAEVLPRLCRENLPNCIATLAAALGIAVDREILHQIAVTMADPNPTAIEARLEVTPSPNGLASASNGAAPSTAQPAPESAAVTRTQPAAKDEKSEIIYRGVRIER